MPDAEESAIIAEYKRKHYEQWLDDPLPALGRRTPRDTVKTSEGRALVESLIAEMELHEMRAPLGEQFDFILTRKALGLLPEIKPGELLRGTWLDASTEGVDQLISISLGDSGSLSLMLHRTPSYERFDPERSGVSMKLLGLDDRDACCTRDSRAFRLGVTLTRDGESCRHYRCRPRSTVVVYVDLSGVRRGRCEQEQHSEP